MFNRSDKRKRDVETDQNCIVLIDIAYRCVYIRIKMMDIYLMDKIYVSIMLIDLASCQILENISCRPRFAQVSFIWQS